MSTSSNGTDKTDPALAAAGEIWTAAWMYSESQEKEACNQFADIIRRHYAELEQANAALRAELDNANKTIEVLKGIIQGGSNIDDTARLDWLDKRAADVSKYDDTEDEPAHYEVWYFDDNDDPSPIFSAPTLREAIDLAMRSSK